MAVVRRIVPDFQGEPKASREFYEDVIGLETAMDLGWVVTYAAPGNPTAQVTIVREEASAAVQPDISIEVDDVDVVYSAAKARGYEILHPLTLEPWGVRRFFVRDPTGKIVNVVTHMR